MSTGRRYVILGAGGVGSALGGLLQQAGSIDVAHRRVDLDDALTYELSVEAANASW